MTHTSRTVAIDCVNGPWRRITGKTTAPRIVDYHGIPVVSFGNQMRNQGRTMVVYRANLIAAAPELLQRLKEARDAIASLPIDALGTRLRWHGCSEASVKDELLGNIDAAIAKAEGEQ